MNPNLRTCCRLFLFFLVSGSISTVKAQGVLAPQDNDYTHLIDRWEILSGKFAPGFHSSFKAYERKGVVDWVDSLAADSGLATGFSKTDRFNLSYLRNDSPEWCDSLTNLSKFKPRWWGPVYRTQNAFYEYQSPDFDLILNPVYYFMGGSDRNTSHSITTNTRGLELRGHIMKKVGFYTYFSDNQVQLPNYVDTRVLRDGVLMGETFWKEYKDQTGYDFFQARGYITFDPIKAIHVQFGYDKNQVGNGYRSLILGSQAAPYTFLKVQTRIWRLQYTNLYAQMKGSPAVAIGKGGGVIGSQLVPTKYMTMHHLSLNLTPNLNIGIFEAIMFSRGDSTGNGGYDLAYMNPIIFYRSVEQTLGSPDNAMLGADARYNFLKHFQVYGQFTLDEFYISDLTSRNNSWRNKFAWQLGAKYYNAFGIRNLDLQAEYNYIRPFTYSHDSQLRNWANYGQPLAHPLGANLTESIGIVRYQPHRRVMITGKVSYTRFGDDSLQLYTGRVVPGTGGSNGHNVLTPYTARTDGRINGFPMYNGINTTLLWAELNVSYMIRHGVWFDFTYTRRSLNSVNTDLNQTTNMITGALRVNIGRRSWEY
jgi:hypothetical protein